MSHCICTLYTENFSGFTPLTIKSFEQFAKLNGFDLVHYNKLFDSTMPPPWNKLYAILDCFAKGYEWVLWADADSIFINHHKFMEQFDLGKTSFLTNVDSNGICTSHIFIENTAYNQKLLETLLFLGDVKDWRVFGEGGIKWEQNALKALVKHFNVKVDVFPPYLVNDYANAPMDERTQFVHVYNRPNRTELLVEVYNKFYPI